MNHNKNENKIDYFQCDCIEPRIKIDENDSKGKVLIHQPIKGLVPKSANQNVKTSKRCMLMSCWI